MITNMNKIILILFSLFTTFSFAQNSVDSKEWYPKENSDNKVEYNANVRYNVNVGTSFSSFGRNMNGYNYYVAPSATLPVGKKTHLTVGFVMSQSSYSGLMMTNEGVKSKMIPNTQAIIYASGSHQINPNITVFASGYYDMNQRNVPYGQRSPYKMYGSEGFSVGAEFKIGEKTRVGIQVQYDRGNIPTYPYGIYGMRNGGFGMGNNMIGMGRPYYGMY